MGFTANDPTADTLARRTEQVIDAIEETFLAQVPVAGSQEDVNAGLDAMRERFDIEHYRDGVWSCRCGFETTWAAEWKEHEGSRPLPHTGGALREGDRETGKEA